MLRIFRDNFVPKYKSGKWVFDKQNHAFKFIARELYKAEPETVLPSPNQIGIIKFKDSIDQVEELILRKEFTRSSRSIDADVITVQDIKNLVLFLAPSHILTPKFIRFVHLETIDKFLNALIIYFEYFLKVVEFLLIRRDELTEKYAKVQGMESVKLKKMLSGYLTQYRILIGREYSKILLETHDIKGYYHMIPVVNISKTISDGFFHEYFLAFCTQVVWIGMHRRAYNTIDCEMNRLFRSGHFNMTEVGTQKTDYIQFNKIEEQVLYGKNDHRANFRAQNSPIIQELNAIDLKNLPILWIGEKKYRGTDIRIYELELEFVIPDSQLVYADIAHGILGHPKKFYDTMLCLDGSAVRFVNYNNEYDPYNLYRSPFIKLPNWENFTKRHETLESYFQLKDVRYNPALAAKYEEIWRNRDQIVKTMKGSVIGNDILLSCQNEIDNMDKEVFIDHDKIIEDFLIESKKRKSKKKN